MTPKAILSGMRPSGKLHLGHLLGVIENWKKLQHEYRCFFMVADLHALTTEYADTARISRNTIDMVGDWLACGIDPDRSVIFRQSDVPEHAELHLMLSMLTPLGWLYSCPTYKEQLREQSSKDLKTYGFLGYPVLQAADILLYRAAVVPVGRDQLPHIELTREIARRFNALYGPFFPEPEGLLTEAPYLPGTDGRKMSKSYGNCINLSDTRDELGPKTNAMFTDPKKVRRNDPGDPSGCVVYALHRLFTADHERIAAACRAGSLGCVADKKAIAATLDGILQPIRERRSAIGEQRIRAVLENGAQRASAVARETMQEVKRLTGLAL
jgi:tryptophanyl-tRNA synthetase